MAVFVGILKIFPQFSFSGGTKEYPVPHHDGSTALISNERKLVATLVRNRERNGPGFRRYPTGAAPSDLCGGTTDKGTLSLLSALRLTRTALSQQCYVRFRMIPRTDGDEGMTDAGKQLIPTPAAPKGCAADAIFSKSQREVAHPVPKPLSGRSLGKKPKKEVMLNGEKCLQTAKRSFTRKVASIPSILTGSSRLQTAERSFTRKDTRDYSRRTSS